jgi:hypothetical protein
MIPVYGVLGSSIVLLIHSEVFVGFLKPSRKMLGQYLKVDHDCFLPYPFEFIIH